MQSTPRESVFMDRATSELVNLWSVVKIFTLSASVLKLTMPLWTQFSTAFRVNFSAIVLMKKTKKTYQLRKRMNMVSLEIPPLNLWIFKMTTKTSPWSSPTKSKLIITSMRSMIFKISSLIRMKMMNHKIILTIGPLKLFRKRISRNNREFWRSNTRSACISRSTWRWHSFFKWLWFGWSSTSSTTTQTTMSSLFVK